VLKGNYKKIDTSFYSQELSDLIGCLLQSKVELRPSCEQILKMDSVVKRRMGATPKYESHQQQLLKTIRMPRKMVLLKSKLPQSKYAVPESLQETEEQSEANTAPLKLDSGSKAF